MNDNKIKKFVIKKYFKTSRNFIPDKYFNKENKNKFIKEKYNIKINHRYISIIDILILLYIFIVIYHPSVYSLNFKFNLNSINFDFEIVATIKEIGNQLILGKGFQPQPYDYPVEEININNEKMYNVKLKWSSLVTNCSEMFYGTVNITMLDFSNFDLSQVVDMSNMFWGCKSLKKINFGNSPISKADNMESMFYDCSSLTSLDLSKFETSLVTNMKNMFYGCSSLTSLDLSNFRTSKVINMDSMFHKTNSLKYLDISNFDTSENTNMANMFSSCGIQSLDLSSFNARKVINMEYMFYQCNSLVSLKFSSNFNSISSKYMQYMFASCSKMESLDLSGFYTNSVINMESIFENCEKLIYLDLLNFNIESATNMKKMFYGCSSLLFINLYSFLESNNVEIGMMFQNTPDNLIFCINEENAPKINNLLQSKTTTNNCSHICFSENRQILLQEKKCIINCSNNGPNKFEYNDQCYSSCPKRTISSSTDIFKCEDLICPYYYNIDETECIDVISSGYYLKDEKLKTIGKCHSDCQTCNKGEEGVNTNCLTCNVEKYLDNGNCVDICEKGSYIDESGTKKCSCSYEIKCKECSEESNAFDLCISCNEGYFQKIDQEPNDKGFIDCYNSLSGYYLDNNFYYPCFSTCNKCFGMGTKDNHNCEECIINYDFINEKNKEKNCYKKCKYYYYFDLDNEYKCTEENECPLDFSYLITEKNKCIDKCSNDDTYKYLYNTKCYEKCPDENLIIDDINFLCKNQEKDSTNEITDFEEKTYITIKTERETSESNKISDIIKNWTSENFFLDLYSSEELKLISKDEIIRCIKEDIINNKMENLLLNLINGVEDDFVIKEGNILYQLTTSDNQNNNTYNNISSIKLGDCENTLKLKYNISENETLIIFKIDYYVTGLLIPIIGYEIFHPITKVKLNLSYCEESTINYTIPVEINENKLFQYDPNSEYYNDECNSYTTEKGTDILINDRKNEFINNNMSLCENLCQYIGYEKTNKKAICKCGIKYKEFILSEMYNETNLLANNFSNENSYSNLGSLACYKTLFTKDGIYNNIGSYIIIFILIFFLICSFIFIKCGREIFNNLIFNVLESKKENSDIHRNRKRHRTMSTKKKIISNPKIKKKISSKTAGNILNKERKKKDKKKTDIIPYKRKESSTSSFIKFNNSPNMIKAKRKKSKNMTKISIFKKNKELIKFIDYEINSFSYKEALINDKRTFFEYYKSLAKTKHPIIFSFLYINDFNILLIKICLFILSFTIHYAFNRLFFTNNVIHKIYEEGGKYNLSYTIRNIILSFFISYYINILLRYIFLTEKSLLELKNQKTEIKANKLVTKIKRIFLIKYICFFIISQIFLILLWYYISTFGAVYQNSQIYLLINSIISFSISLVYPFIFNLIPCCFRIYSLRDKKKKKEFIYKISKIIQIL